jgi:hypothetical protein
MGASQSSENKTPTGGIPADSSGMFQHAMNYINSQNAGVTGGYESDSDAQSSLFYGGALADDSEIIKDLDKYRKSKSAKAKGAIIKGIISTLNDLGLVTDSTKDIDAIVDEVKNKIPNPRKGESFVEDAQKQKTVCKKLAHAINSSIKKVYGDGVGDLIDIEGPPEYVCSTVVDLLHSFSSGIHLEFLKVYKSVQKVLKELSQAQEVLKQSVNQMSKYNDPDMELDAQDELNKEKFQELYKRAEREIEIKIQQLNGLLDLTLLPASEELKLALEGLDTDKEFINKFVVPGTDSFGDSIAYTLNSMGTVAAITNMLNKSLSQVGMNMEEYMTLKHINDLDKFLDKKLDEAIKISNSEKKKKDINNILLAVDQLKKYFGQRKKLQKMKGGAVTYKDASEIRAKELDKRIERAEKAKKLFEETFSKELYSAYEKLLESVDTVGPKIGKSIPITGGLDNLIQAFYRLAMRDLRSEFIDQALIGIKYDYRSKEIKKSFIQSLEAVVNAINNLSSGAENFSEIKKAIAEIIAVIDRYTKIAKAKYGGSVEGGAVEEVEGGRVLFHGTEKLGHPKYKASAIKLDEAVGKMVYYYYIASIRDNIKSTAGELKEYGKDYTKILTNAMRFKRDALLKLKKRILKEIDDDGQNGNPARITNAHNADKTVEEIKADMKQTIEEIYQARDQLFQVVESIELYLKSYTKKIVTDPNVVKELKKALDSSNIITKWFNEESGNSLVKAFQALTLGPKNRKKMAKAEKQFKQAPATAGLWTDKHPYNEFRQGFLAIVNANQPNAWDADADVRARIFNAQVVGGPVLPDIGMNPFRLFNWIARPAGGAAHDGMIPLDSLEDTDVDEHISNAIDNFQALQNIINAFITIIPLESMDENVLSARQMYKYLTNYLKISALTEVIVQQGVNLPANGQIMSEYALRFAKIEDTKVPTAGPGLRGAAALGDRPDGDEDHYYYFVAVIKAIMSKIMVTLGMYELYEAPAQLKGITPARFLLGGDNDLETPKIKKEAVELYYRVPRMVEYYRSKLDFEIKHTQPGHGDNESVMSFVLDPEMRFFNLFNLMWDRIELDTILNGTYSDIECNQIIKCINEIYEEYKSHENPIKKVLMEINFEVNRRFGMINGNEYKKLRELKRWRKDGELGEFGSSVVSMLDILPDEGDLEFSGVPSDNLILEDITTEAKDLDIRKKYDVKDSNRLLITRFREDIEQDLAGLSQNIGDYIRNTYKNALHQTQQNVEEARSEEERAKIAKRLIVGDQKLATISQSKVLMFHETVVYGLTVLNGLYRLVEDYKYTIDQITGLGAGGLTPDQKKQATKLLMMTIYRYTCDKKKLIKASYGNAQHFVQFDFSNLKATVESLIGDVRKYLDMFRPYLPEVLIARYEGELVTKELDDPANRYKLIFYEEKFFRFFSGREELEEYDDAEYTAIRAETVYGYNKRLNAYLAQHVLGAASVPFGSEISELVYYNTENTDNKVIKASDIASSQLKLDFGMLFSKHLATNTRGALDPLQQEGVAGASIESGNSIDFNAHEEILQFTSSTAANVRNPSNHPSLLVRFNDTIRQFLKVFYDKPKSKFYSNLLQHFATGTLSSAISSCIDPSGIVFPDIIDNRAAENNLVNQAVGLDTIAIANLQDINPNAVLSLSNALIIRNLLYTMTPMGTQFFVSSNISEISTYIRESYKVNLPLFIKELETIISYAEYLNDTIENTKDVVDYSRHFANPAAHNHVLAAGTHLAGAHLDFAGNRIRAANASAIFQAPVHDSAEQHITYIKSLIRNITEASVSMKEACERVYREVSEEQVYLQYEPDLFAKYHSKHNKYPVSLMSFALYPLKMTADPIFAPTSDINNVYRFHYGADSVLLDLDILGKPKMPFNKELVDEYNKSVPERDTAHLAEYEAFVNKTTDLIKYFVNYKHYRFYTIKEFVAPAPDRFRFIISGDMENYRRQAVAAAVNDIPHLAYETQSAAGSFTLDKLFEIMTSTDSNRFTEQFKNHVTQGLGAAAAAVGRRFNIEHNRTRQDQRFYNFVDLNMIPFNPNAFMREIPLTNIYNYTYSLDKILAQTLQNNPNNYNFALDAISKIMEDPYTNSLNVNNVSVYYMLTGDPTTQYLGRPKYLSDQIYNKVLYGNIYDTEPNLAPNTLAQRHRFGVPDSANIPDAAANIAAIADANNDVALIRGRNGNKALTYPALHNNKLTIKSIQVTDQLAARLEAQGRSRFNTVIVRNLIFITTAYRILRARLEEDLVKKYDLIAPAHELVNPKITEYDQQDNVSQDKSKFSELVDSLRE